MDWKVLFKTNWHTWLRLDPNTWVPAHGEIMVLDPTWAGWRWFMEEFCTKVLAEGQVVELQNHQNPDCNTNNHQQEQLGGSNSLP